MEDIKYSFYVCMLYWYVSWKTMPHMIILLEYQPLQYMLDYF